MKLLLDQNLSHKIVANLGDLFPESTHVRHLGLASADDAAIWQWAKVHEFCIVSKDDDFHQRSFLYGAPPKVVWLRLGNCTSQAVLNVLRSRVLELLAFDADDKAAFLVLR